MAQKRWCTGRRRLQNKIEELTFHQKENHYQETHTKNQEQEKERCQKRRKIRLQKVTKGKGDQESQPKYGKKNSDEKNHRKKA